MFTLSTVPISELNKGLENLELDDSSQPKQISSDGGWPFHGLRGHSRSRSPNRPDPSTHSHELLSADRLLVYQRNPHTQKSEQPSHGLALIISNGKFDKLTERNCCHFDEYRLEDTFKKLGYRVVIKKNKSSLEMSQIFSSIERNEPGELNISGNDDSFVCLISSHGDWDKDRNTDFIYGRDGDPKSDKSGGKFFLKQEAYGKLNAINCPHLRGRPKLFFVQACRGKQYGKIVADSGGAQSGIGIKNARRLPRESDFLISYSTAEETKSFRLDPGALHAEGPDISKEEQTDGDLKVGSFYITELCNALTKFSPRLDLVHIMLSVHQTLQGTEKNLFCLDEGDTRQCPHLMTSLRGPVFFFDEAEKKFRDYVEK